MWKRSFFLTNDLGVRYVAFRSVAFHIMSKLDVSKCVSGMNFGMIFLLRHGVVEFLEVYPGGQMFVEKMHLQTNLITPAISLAVSSYSIKSAWLP
jgi:hypothetical protein